jgi:hypothetical protein
VEPIDKIAAGAIAFLWMQSSHDPQYEDGDTVRGFMQRDDDGTVHVRGLDESSLDASEGLFGVRKPAPTCVTAATEFGGAVLTGVVGRSQTRSFGGARASVMRLRTHTLMAPVDLAALNTTRVYGVSAYFPEGLGWAGEGAVSEEWKFDSDSKITEVKYVVSGSSPALPAGKYGAMNLEIEPHWKSSGVTQESLHIDTSLEIRVTSLRPRDISSFIPILLGVQNLLSLAHDRFVLASGGKSALDAADGAASSTALWQRDLMASPRRPTATPNDDPAPLLRLEDLGGASALSRWLRLCDAVPEAVAATTGPYRRGAGLSPTLRLQEIAGAIEYYVNTARVDRDVAWAKKGSSDSHAHALAKRVGKPFEQFVGDPKLWAQTFVGAYNGLKHNPSFPRDDRSLRLLAVSGDLLLMAALLNRTASSGLPARKIFRDYRIENLGDSLRSDVLGL